MRKLALWLLFLGLTICGFSKTNTDVIPNAPNPPRLVNDFAGVMTQEQIDEMEMRLVAFNDSTSNVICVVTVLDLGDYSSAQFAYEIGDRWGVRSKDKRNGVVILIKPSSGQGTGDGDVYISVGYDLEGAIPDAIAKRIIEKKMIPDLANGDYHAAIDSALAYILPLASGEISAEQLTEDDDDDGVVTCITFIIIVLIFYWILKTCGLVGRKKSGGSGYGGSGSSGGGYYSGPTYMGGYGGSSYGDSSGGYSSSGGGGFRGFGGSGGFGGGGAGGRF